MFTNVYTLLKTLHPSGQLRCSDKRNDNTWNFEDYIRFHMLHYIVIMKSTNSNIAAVVPIARPKDVTYR